MTQNKKLQYLIPALITLVIAIVFFAVGSKYDKSISEHFYNQYQLNIPVSSIILCLVVPLITNAFGSFAATALFITSNKRKLGASIFFKIVAAIALFFIGYFAYSSGSEFAHIIVGISDDTRTLLKFIIFCIVIVMDIVIAIFTYRRLKKTDTKNIFWVSLTMLVIIAGIAASGEVIKYLASRPRPRIVFPGMEPYKEWWQWNPLYGFKVDESKSFVSGHSINAAATITLLPLYLSTTKFAEKKNMLVIATSIGCLYWLVIAISRVLAIAHFVTDVAGACILSIVLQILILFVMEKIQLKTDNKVPVSN